MIEGGGGDLWKYLTDILKSINLRCHIVGKIELLLAKT